MTELVDTLSREDAIKELKGIIKDLEQKLAKKEKITSEIFKWFVLNIGDMPGLTIGDVSKGIDLAGTTTRALGIWKRMWIERKQIKLKERQNDKPITNPRSY